jgi:hypothetical protein
MTAIALFKDDEHFFDGVNIRQHMHRKIQQLALHSDQSGYVDSDGHVVGAARVVHAHISPALPRVGKW